MAFFSSYTVPVCQKAKKANAKLRETSENERIFCFCNLKIQENRNKLKK